MPIYMMRESGPTPVTTDGVYWSQSLGLISRVENGSTIHTMADKNLGASVVWNEGDTFSASNCGDFYQRGNNYGFDYSGPSTTSNTPVDPTGYGPGNYYSSSTFITNPNYPYSWWSTFNANLRGDTTDTVEARQGPCPSGFHIPASAELSGCISIFGSASGHGKSILDVFKMPPCGNINYDGTLYHPTVYPMAGYYRTSSKYVTSQAGLVYINYNNNSSPDTQGTNRGDAYPIRPFKNTVVQPDSTRTALFQPA